MRAGVIPAAAFAAVLAVSPVQAQCGPPGFDTPAARDSLLVDARWLAPRLGWPGLVVLHVDHDRSGYDAGHIAGSVYADAGLFSTDAGPGTELPSPLRLDSVIEGLGISNESHVVIVPGHAWMAPRAFLALEYAGLRGQVHVLDGGTAAWRAAGHRLTTEVPRVRRGRFTVRPDTAVVVDAAWVRGHLADPAVALVDTRTAAEYAGTARERLPRTGHIPGARLLEWTRTFAAPAAAERGEPTPLLPPAELRRLLAEAGVVPGRAIVFYCTVGLRAAHLYVVARSLGIPARLYDGSFADWSARPGFPITRGDRP